MQPGFRYAPPVFPRGGSPPAVSARPDENHTRKSPSASAGSNKTVLRNTAGSEQNEGTNNGRQYDAALPFAAGSLGVVVGSAIGWGSLVVTSRSYLSQAGPMGSILGLVIGFVMMLMVSSHYHFLSNRYPGTGGPYHYVKQLFGFDFACLKTLTFSSLSGQRSSMRRRP